MRSYLFILLTLMLMVLMSCDNPFERIQNDIDAIKSIRNIEESINNVESYLKETEGKVFDADKVAELINDINKELDTVLKSEGAVSILREEYDGDLKEELEDFKLLPKYNLLDNSTKDMLDNIIIRIDAVI